MRDINYFYTSEIGVNDCRIIYMKKFYRAQLRRRFISNIMKI